MFRTTNALVIPLPLVLILLVACGVHSDNGASSAEKTPLLPANTSMNRVELERRESAPFRFVTMGHIYGRPGKGRARPSTTFVKSIPKLNASEIDLCVLMGDCFYKWEEKEVKPTTDILKKLSFPIINSVGNHDVVRREDYKAVFGATWYAFSYGGSRFFIADTEEDSWHISDEQLIALHEEFSACLGDNPPDNLFIFAHKVVWAGTKETAVCALGSNDPGGMGVFVDRPADRPNFNRDIRPRMREASQKVPIYFFAGDIGAFSNKIHLFKQKDTHEASGELYYLASGLGDFERDAAIVVEVNAEGRATLSGLELATGKTVSLDTFNAAYWEPKVYPKGKMPNIIKPFLEK